MQLDGGEVSSRRLDAALLLAKRFEARLTGLFAQKESDPAALVARRPSAHFEAAATNSLQNFEEATSAAGVEAQWRSLAHGDPGFLVAETGYCARYFDLALVGQGSFDYSPLPDDLVERVVAESGRPVLVIPQSGAPATLGSHAVIAWNGSRESSRALHDALPLLRRAERVTLLTVPPDDKTPPHEILHLDAIDHLARHQVTAKLERIRAEDIGLMDFLLSRAYDLGADLLVMGAPAGKGSGTRFLLRHLTLPVLISG